MLTYPSCTVKSPLRKCLSVRQSSMVCQSVCNDWDPHKNGSNDQGADAVWTWVGPSNYMQGKIPPQFVHCNASTATVYGPFSEPPRWAGARRELLDFMVQGKINTGRHTDHPAARHSIHTNQCPPIPSPIFYRPYALPAAPATVSKHWRQAPVMRPLTEILWPLVFTSGRYYLFILICLSVNKIIVFIKFTKQINCRPQRSWQKFKSSRACSRYFANCLSLPVGQ